MRVIRLAPVGKMPTLASIGPLPAPYPVTEFPIPEKGLEELNREWEDCARGIRACEAALHDAARHLPSIHDQMLKTQNAAEYSAVSNTSQSQDGLVWLTGYIPAAEVEGFKKAAAQAHCAWAMEDPAADDDKVPTKVKYNKVTRLMIPVFDILGVVPGYREYDISFWFLGFFTLFFAMIIGDAGYGCLFLLAALVMTLKNKKASTAVQLLWLLSIATIVWGALTGTWFGLEQAMDVPLLKSLVIPTFANYPAHFGVESTTQQNTIMKFCFILGTVQLSLACVMNIRRKLGEKDLSWLADLGWLAAIDALYFVVLYLVIGQQVNLMPVACVVIAGFLLVVLFGGMSPDKTFGQGLKAGLGDAFTVFLNTISAFGNIMSYIRLFAVGMASLAIAQSFNNMAFGRVVEADNRALNATLDEAAARGDMDANTAAGLRDTLHKAYREHAQTPRRLGGVPGYVSVETFAERPPVVERICALIDKGFRPCDIMILVRGATDGAKVAAELLDFKRRNEDPRYRFDVMTQEALIVGNAPVSSFIAAALRLSLNPDDSLSRAVYNHYLGRGFDRPLPGDERTFFRSIRLLSPEEAFERIVMRHALHDDRQQTAYLQAIHEQIIGFCASKIADIALFLDWGEKQGQNRSLSVDESATTVELTTIHKAKGLEKRVVLIPWCSWQLDPKSGGNVTNIVWAEAQGDAGAVGRFPVKYKKAMAESGFSAEYYRELVYSHVDNINLLYVALTRAAESLHVFIPRKGGKSVGGLLLQSIGADGDKALLDGTEGRRTATEEGERFEFGRFTGPVPGGGKASDSVHVVLENYPTARADLRLRLPSQRYFEEEDEVELSPRNFGILMHKAFEQADDRQQIYEAVQRMRDDGTLSPGEAEALRGMIARVLAHPVAGEWFGGGWQRVRNENEIIVPGAGSPRRPARVMIRGTRAVVVDYKFGSRDPGRYRRQVGEYLGLLRQMGYTQCEGYLWYVKLGEIEKVEG